MRAVVLGATGFIGRHLVKALGQCDVDVTAVARRPASSGAGARAVAADIAETAVCAGLCRGADVVLVLACDTTPADTPLDPVRELDANLAPLARLLPALRGDSPPHVVFFSSGGTVYGDAEGRPDEGTATAPRSFYGASKVASEAFLRAASCQFAIPLTILRPANVYGPGQRGRPSFGVVPALLAAARDGTPFHRYGGGAPVRDYLFIDDLLDLVMKVALGAPPAAPACFNVGSGEGTSLNALVGQVEAVTGRKVAIEERPARETDVRGIILDTGRAQRALGWTPRTSLEEGLRSTWAALLAA